jgi:hypothetical protein
MQSIRNKIISDVFELIKTIPGANVFRSRTEALSQSDLPAVIIRPESEQVNSEINKQATRKLTLVFTCYAAGTPSDEQADAIAVEISTKMLSDIRRNGLALNTEETAYAWDFEDGETDLTAIEIRYDITYRTSLFDQKYK